MPSIDAVAVRGALGEYCIYEPVSLYRWRGESNCLVGPFSCREVAERFTRAQVDFGQYEAYVELVLAVRDSWYVEIRAALAEAAV
jgi:hypothetical protein